MLQSAPCSHVHNSMGAGPCLISNSLWLRYRGSKCERATFGSVSKQQQTQGDKRMNKETKAPVQMQNNTQSPVVYWAEMQDTGD